MEYSCYKRASSLKLYGSRVDTVSLRTPTDRIRREERTEEDEYH